MANRKRDHQHPNWCFTYNYDGPGQPDRDACERFLEHLDKVSQYNVAGFELAPTTKQAHAQGYVQFLSRKRLTELKKFPDGSTCHWEVAKRDEVDNRTYCLKSCGDDYHEFGEAKPCNGGAMEAERWAEARKSARENRLDDIPDQIFIQHYASVRSIARDYLKLPEQAADVTGLWLYGLTGSGKSRTAREEFGTDPNQLYLKPINKWWDGYKDQPYVLLEDFGKEHKVLGYHLKVWADRYAFPAEIKGSTIAVRPSRLIVTSQYHPRDIWGDDLDTLNALLRRFKLRFIGDAANNPWDAISDLSAQARSAAQPMEDLPMTSTASGESSKTERASLQCLSATDLRCRVPCNESSKSARTCFDEILDLTL